MGCVASAMSAARDKPTASDRRASGVSKDLFVLEAVIGEGGFGRVLTGLFLLKKKWLAIKEINKHELLRHKTGMAMLVSELGALKRVDHVFVARLHFSFHTPASIYIVLDLKTGGDLRYYLRKKLLFEEANVAFYVSCISSALAHCHAHHVIHRDVKPENIILDDKGFPHLVDFGVAYVQTERSPDGSLVSRLASGTKQYLAPEVFTKAHVHGPECDYWALGVVAYELLHGKRPFEKHCPYAFITYLESGLAARQKERERDAMMGAGLGGCGSVAAREGRDCSRATGHLSILTSKLGVSTTGMCSLSSGAPSPSMSSTGASSPASTCWARTSNSVSTPGSHADPDSPAVSARQLPLLFPALSVGSTTSASSPPKSKRSPRHEDYLPSPGADDLGGGKDYHRDPSMPAASQVGVSHSPSSATFPLCSPGVVHTFGADSHGPTQGTADPAIFGDHWLVDEGLLSSSLRVPIPSFNVWLGNISPNCVSMLEGLFEVRPSHRLGGRRIESLRTHPWLHSQGLSDWASLTSKTTQAPHFIPGKLFGPRTEDREGKDKKDSKKCEKERAPKEEDSLAEKDSPRVTAEQERAFVGLDFISPIYRDVFPDAFGVSTQTQGNVLTGSGTTANASSTTSAGAGMTAVQMQSSSSSASLSGTGAQTTGSQGSTPSGAKPSLRQYGGTGAGSASWSGSGLGSERDSQSHSHAAPVVSVSIVSLSSRQAVPSSAVASSGGASGPGASIASQIAQSHLSQSQAGHGHIYGYGHGLGQTKADSSQPLPSVRPSTSQQPYPRAASASTQQGAPPSRHYLRKCGVSGAGRTRG